MSKQIGMSPRLGLAERTRRPLRHAKFTHTLVLITHPRHASQEILLENRGTGSSRMREVHDVGGGRAKPLVTQSSNQSKRGNCQKRWIAAIVPDLRVQYNNPLFAVEAGRGDQRMDLHVLTYPAGGSSLVLATDGTPSERCEAARSSLELPRGLFSSVWAGRSRVTWGGRCVG